MRLRGLGEGKGLVDGHGELALVDQGGHRLESAVVGLDLNALARFDCWSAAAPTFSVTPPGRTISRPPSRSTSRERRP